MGHTLATPFNLLKEEKMGEVHGKPYSSLMWEVISGKASLKLIVHGL